MPKKKVIENYELQQLISTDQQLPYETYQAYHLTQKTHFTIKKLKLKHDKHSLISDLFIHEAALLKPFKHINISKPLKMLKTSTSLYVVYENCQGSTLSQYLQNESKQKKSKHTLSQKQSIIKQLCSMLLQLSKCGIAHLCLSPQCIFVSQNIDIKVTNFLFAINLPDNDQELQLQEEIKEAMPITEFTASQIKKGKASAFSDVYSFGKIIQHLDLNNSKKGTLSTKEFEKKIETYNEIIKKTTKRKPFQRLSIEQVYQTYLIPKSKLKKMQSMSMSMSKIMSGKQSMISRANSSSTTSMMGGKNAAFVEEMIMMIIKRHNMAKFLVQLIKNITLCEQHPRPQQLIILCAMLLKKSTLVINSLGKFMKYCKGIPSMDLNEKQRNRMMKSGDFIKLQPIIDSQVKQQRKLYQQSLESIYLNNPKLLQNKRFNQELKKEQIDQEYFLQLITNLVTTSTNQIMLQDQHSSFLKSIYILMMVVENGGVEKFFQKKIIVKNIDLTEQPVFTRLYHEMTIPQIIQQLKEKFTKKQPTPEPQ